jgi:hypothetical protein
LGELDEICMVSQNSALHKYVIAAVLVLIVEDFGEWRRIVYFSLANYAFFVSPHRLRGLMTRLERPRQTGLAQYCSED